MFPVEEAFGKKIDRAYSAERAKWERLYEATQTKGDGETHPILSPTDEFANFERWDKGNLDGSQAKTKEMLEFEYARSALKNGLEARGAARRQSLQVRPGREQRRPYGAARDGGGELLRQDHAAGAQPGTHRSDVHEQPEDGHRHQGLGGQLLRLRRGVGEREHARVLVGRDAAQGDVRDHRLTHARALLRRI
jgi:hypothetical protein